jgi:N-acyl-D-aspartate/D-glutamate deacylase
VTYDLVVRGGTVVTASDSFAADIGVRAGRVAAMGEALAPGTAEIAAAGLLVLSGGVDVHTKHPHEARTPQFPPARGARVRQCPVVDNRDPGTYVLE